MSCPQCFPEGSSCIGVRRIQCRAPSVRRAIPGGRPYWRRTYTEHALGHVGGSGCISVCRNQCRGPSVRRAIPGRGHTGGGPILSMPSSWSPRHRERPARVHRAFVGVLCVPSRFRVSLPPSRMGIAVVCCSPRLRPHAIMLGDVVLVSNNILQIPILCILSSTFRGQCPWLFPPALRA